MYMLAKNIFKLVIMCCSMNIILLRKDYWI